VGNDRCLVAAFHSCLALISMADHPSSTAAKQSKKKGGGIVKRFRHLFKRSKSANDSVSQSNSTRVSVSSATGADGPAPGNDAGSAAPMASSKYISTILVLSDSTFSAGGNVTLNQGMYYPGFLPHRSSGLSPSFRSYHPLPVSKTSF
jgi:hypothetical protein